MRSEAGSEGKQMVVPKGSGCRLACGVVVVVALAITGCSGSKPSAEKCAEVSAALSDVPTRTDQEPKMRSHSGGFAMFAITLGTRTAGS